MGRLQKINMTQFEYRAYRGKQERLTPEGRHTGEPELIYDDPVAYEGNISVNYGYAAQKAFGLDTNYTHVLIMEDPDADIKEEGLIDWNGDTYEIRSVVPSLNYLSVSLRKRTKNAAKG